VVAPRRQRPHDASTSWSAHCRRANSFSRLAIPGGRAGAIMDAARVETGTTMRNVFIRNRVSSTNTVKRETVPPNLAPVCVLSPTTVKTTTTTTTTTTTACSDDDDENDADRLVVSLRPDQDKPKSLAWVNPPPPAACARYLQYSYGTSHCNNDDSYNSRL
jgi:hypothetical protein